MNNSSGKILRRLFSVMLAVVMLLSCWVFTPVSLKAEAADGGKYTVRVTFSSDSNLKENFGGTIGTEYNDSHGIVIKYKKDNGLGDDAQTYFNLKGNNQSGTKTATIDGFPTLLYMYFDDNRAAIVGGTGTVHCTKLEIKGENQSNSDYKTLWSGDLQIKSVYNPYAISVDCNGTIKKDYFGNDSDCKANSNSGGWTDKFPYANSMTASYASSSKTCPKPGEADVTNKLTYGATDQYDVVMASKNCTVTVKGSQSNTTGISTTSGNGEDNTTITSAANIAGTTNSQTVTATCSWAGSQDKSKTASFTLYDCDFTATYKYYTSTTTSTTGVSASKTATAKYGSNPTQPSGIPTSYYTSDKHYSGGSFTAITNMTADKSVTMSYSSSAVHSFTYTDYDNINHTKSCSCGYSVNVAHSWANTETYTKTAATCENDAVYYKECSFCHVSSQNKGGATWTKTNSALGHNWTDTETYPATQASCEGNAVFYKECSRCHISSQNKTGATWEKGGSALGHNYTNVTPTWSWTGYTAASAVFKCTRCPHTETRTASISDNGAEATCESGATKIYTATVTFNSANFTDSVQETLNALGHVWTDTEKYTETAATCEGNAVYYEECSRCNTSSQNKTGATWTKENSALGHSWTQTERYLKSEATCVDNAVYYKECSRDNCHASSQSKNASEVWEKPDSTNSLNHKSLSVDPGTPATSTDIGLTDGEHCQACNTVTIAQEIIPATGLSKVYETTRNSQVIDSRNYISVTNAAPTELVTTKAPVPEYVAQGRFGTMTVSEDGKAKYTVTTMNFNDIDSFWLLTQVSGTKNDGTYSAYVYEKVNIVPSRTLYYEDDFESNGITYSNGNTKEKTNTYGQWQVKTTTSAQAAVNDFSGADNGEDYATLSKGAAHTVSVAEINNPSKGGVWPSTEFTFSGTGFDIIGLTDSNSGVFFVTVSDPETKKNVYTALIDTYYGYTYCQLYFNTVTRKIVGEADGNTIPLYFPKGDEDESTIIEAGLKNKKYTTVNTGNVAYGWLKSTTSDVIYQVPVLKVKDLEYGTYKVTVEARFTAMFGHYNVDADENKYFDLCLDAVRIYDPAGEKIEDAYSAAGEGKETEISIRNQIIGADKLNGEQHQGALFIEGTDYAVTEELLKDYLAVSPKNEVYLNKGQSITFSVNTNGYADVQIGMRSVGKPVSVTVAYNNETWNKNINNATQTYYSFNTMFSSKVNGTITVTNTSDSDAILSLTNIKTIADCNAQVEYVASPMMLYPQTATEAMALLCMENSDLSVDEEKTQAQTSDDGTIKLTVVTSNDVSTLIITDESGNVITPEEVTNAPGDGDTIVWTVTLSESESGVYTYYIQGAYENGYTNCEPISVTVTVEIASDGTGENADNEPSGNFFERLMKAIIEFLNRLFSIIKK